MSNQLEELFSGIMSGQVAIHSEMGTRDENIQSRNFDTPFHKLKLKVDMNSRVLAFKDVVLPFNPRTGAEDETYNSKTPFRPILLVHEVGLMLKKFISADEKLKDVYAAKLKGALSDGDDFTMDDYYLMKHAGFIKPRIHTYHTMALNFGGKFGFSDFKQRYTVDPTELNASGGYDPENAPITHKGALFFNAMLKPEWDALQREAQAKGVTNKEQLSGLKRSVFSKSPIGFVGPTNLIPFVAFPKGEPIPQIEPDRTLDVENHIYYMTFTDKWVTPISSVMKDDLADESMDFYDFTLATPDKTAVNPSTGKVYTDDDSVALYTASTLNCTDSRTSILSGKSVGENGGYVENSVAAKSLLDALHAYFIYSQGESANGAEGRNFEKLMAVSNRMRPISSAMPNFLAAANDVFLTSFANSKYFTEEIKTQHSEFYTALNPADHAMALAAYDDDDLKSAANQGKLNAAAIIADASDEPDESVKALDTLESLDFGVDLKVE